MLTETLKPKETATECFCLVVNSDNSNDKHLEQCKLPTIGDYFIEWKRKNVLSIAEKKENSDTDTDTETEDDDEENTDTKAPSKVESDSEDCFNVKTKIALPEISAEPFPFLVEAVTPTYGSLAEQLTIVYKIFNKTNTYLDIECSLEQNEFFALAGKKMVTFVQQKKKSFLIYN